jgi:hypothetical protein
LREEEVYGSAVFIPQIVGDNGMPFVLPFGGHDRELHAFGISKFGFQPFPLCR